MAGGLDPFHTTIGDLINQALKDCGFLGVGQTPLAEDTTDAQIRLQWMLQQWAAKRYHVFHLVTYLITSTGALYYTVGPGGQIDTGAASERPIRLEAAFVRQLVGASPNQIDTRLELVQSMEDYSTIPLKTLSSFPSVAFYDPTFPLGKLYVYPVPQAGLYASGIVVMEQLPIKFASLTTELALPFMYYQALVSNLALQLRIKYGIPNRPGDMLPVTARTSLNTIKVANVAIARLTLPSVLIRGGIYNIFSDKTY